LGLARQAFDSRSSTLGVATPQTSYARIQRRYLFLTTNRINDIDDAFHSRIRITMEYPDLKAMSLRQIWATFLQASSRKNEVDAKSLGLLADINLNGRQIKNVLKIAGIVGCEEEQPDAA
jgi:hypothetical protein